MVSLRIDSQVVGMYNEIMYKYLSFDNIIVISINICDLGGWFILKMSHIKECIQISRSLCRYI